MELIERGGRIVFKVLFGVLFGGVFLMLALETAIRRFRDDRRIAGLPPATDLEAIYRNRAGAGRVPAPGPYHPRARSSAVNAA